eukprot:g16655.t1
MQSSMPNLPRTLKPLRASVHANAAELQQMPEPGMEVLTAEEKQSKTLSHQKTIQAMDYSTAQLRQILAPLFEQKKKIHDQHMSAIDLIKNIIHKIAMSETVKSFNVACLSHIDMNQSYHADEPNAPEPWKVAEVAERVLAAAGIADPVLASFLINQVTRGMQTENEMMGNIKAAAAAKEAATSDAMDEKVMPTRLFTENVHHNRKRQQVYTPSPLQYRTGEDPKKEASPPVFPTGFMGAKDMYPENFAPPTMAGGLAVSAEKDVKMNDAAITKRGALA